MLLMHLHLPTIETIHIVLFIFITSERFDSVIKTILTHVCKIFSELMSVLEIFSDFMFKISNEEWVK